jgi:hypothetical protein
MSTDALARLLCEADGVPDGYWGWYRKDADRLTADPGPLLEALVEAGMLERAEQARIHYRYGVNSGTLTSDNTPGAIAAAVRGHEQLTMGPVGVERVEVRVWYEHLTDWRPQ